MPVTIVKGPKLDQFYREMWFKIVNGKKIRIGWKTAYAMLAAKTAVEKV